MIYMRVLALGKAVISRGSKEPDAIPKFHRFEASAPSLEPCLFLLCLGGGLKYGP